MADAIAPPTVRAPLSAADVAIIRAEKQLDEDTRGRLVQLYGESRTALGRHIALRRPPAQAWRCPRCAQTSDDIRHVCGTCLAPEPRTTTSSTTAAARPSLTELRPGAPRDAWTAVRVVAQTGRCYRQFTDPVARPTLGARAGDERGRPIDLAMLTGRHDDSGGGGDDDGYMDEPHSDEDGAPCRPDAGVVGDDHSEHADPADASMTATLTTAAGPMRAVGKAITAGRTPPEGRTPFTHFVSLPVGKLPAVAGSAEALLTALRAYAVESAEDTAAAATHLAPELVSSAAKLHVTLLLLSLPTAQDVAFAKELLEVFGKRWASGGRQAALAASAPACSPAEGSGLSLRFKGLHVMPTRGKGSRTQVEKASVVYMGLADDASTRAVRALQDLLHECFAELIPAENREEVERTKTNLHVTVMNKKWRRHGAKRPFDATGILKKFGDAVLSGAIGEEDASVVVPCVELNRMSGRDANAGAYAVEAKVPI